MPRLILAALCYIWLGALAHSDAAFNATSGQFGSILTHWFSGGTSGKTVVFAGDSTTAFATAMLGSCAQPGPCTTGYLYTNGQQTGQFLSGTTILNQGNNGLSLAGFLQGGLGAFPYASLVAANPTLIVFCYGINDVRLGTTSQAQLIALLQQFLDQIHIDLPNADILLWGPNTLLDCNCSGMNYVQPTASAQSYSDILYNSYAAFKSNGGGYANVGVLQKQDLVTFTRFTSTVITPYMQDELHPNVGPSTKQTSGQLSEAFQILYAIGYH